MIARAEQGRLSGGRLDRATPVCVCLLMVALSAAFLANSMVKPVSRDEQMYCTAGVLVAEGHTVYRDFAYPSQLPYHPLLLATVYRIFGTTHYLLVGRLVSVVCDIGVLITLLWIYRRAFGSHGLEGWLLGLAAVLLYAFNPLVTWACGYAWNHDVVILCVLVSLALAMTSDFRARSQRWRLALMGALLMFATCMRVTTALVAALFLVDLFVRAGGSVGRRMRAVLPFSLAALAVLAWPLWIFIQTPQAVRINLLEMPVLYARWLRDIGMTHDKVVLTLASLTSPGYLALLGAAVYLGVMMVRRRSKMTSQAWLNMMLATLLAIAFIVIAFIPPTMWDQYWAMPVPFLVVFLAFPLAQLRRGAETPEGAKPFRVACWVIVLSVVCTIYANAPFAIGVRKVVSPGRWIPLKLHRTASDMARNLPKEEPVLTLGPLYALEAGRDIYLELATGPIVYRIADSMRPEQRALARCVGPDTLGALTSQRPPAAVILGVETSPSSLEAALRNIIPDRWSHESYDTDLQVYFRP